MKHRIKCIVPKLRPVPPSYKHEIEDQPKTKRYSFNEKGEIIDVNKRVIVPRIKVKEILIENHDHMLA